MNIIVDTSVWIDSFNPKIKTLEKDALERLIQHDYPIYLCPIIIEGNKAFTASNEAGAVVPY